MKNITSLIVVAGALLLGWFIFKQIKSNQANASTDTGTSFIIDDHANAIHSVTQDEGIVTTQPKANNQPITAPSIPVATPSNYQSPSDILGANTLREDAYGTKPVKVTYLDGSQGYYNVQMPGTSIAPSQGYIVNPDGTMMVPAPTLAEADENLRRLGINVN